MELLVRVYWLRGFGAGGFDLAGLHEAHDEIFQAVLAGLVDDGFLIALDPAHAHDEDRALDEGEQGGVERHREALGGGGKQLVDFHRAAAGKGHGIGDADDGAEEAERGNHPDEVADERVAQVETVLEQFEAGIEQGVDAVDGFRFSEFHGKSANEGGQRVFAWECARFHVDGAQVVGGEQGALVFGQQTRTEHAFFRAHGAPAQPEFAHANEHGDPHERLDGIGIAAVGQRAGLIGKIGPIHRDLAEVHPNDFGAIWLGGCDLERADEVEEDDEEHAETASEKKRQQTPAIACRRDGLGT